MEKRICEFECEGSSGRELDLTFVIHVSWFIAISTCAILRRRFDIFIYAVIYIYIYMCMYMFCGFAFKLYLLVWDITKCNECPP